MFKLSSPGVEFVKKEMQRYETKLSAIIPCLYRIQDENGGWISPECVSYLSQLMDLSESEIYEVLTFYTMFNKKPAGKFHIQVCCNITCAMKGSQKLLRDLKAYFDTHKENSVCTFSAVECLGSCDTAPVVQINRETYTENATLENTKEAIKQKINSHKIIY